MNIGIIGEAPHDSDTIQILLQQLLKEEHSFFNILGKVRGGMWDSDKYIELLKVEFATHKPSLDVVILMRDKDALEADNKNKKERAAFFTKTMNAVNHKGIKLLHIWELEALLFADIKALSAFYDKPIVSPHKDVMLIEDPKGELMKQTSGLASVYSESHSAKIALLMNAELLLDKSVCKYFHHFYRELRNCGVK
jgi:hypothetical protein